MTNNLNQNSIVSELINSADARGIYVDKGELERSKEYFQSRAERLSVVAAISSNVTVIIEETMRKQCSLSNSSNVNYTNRQYAACLRDLNLFLRYLSYAILADDSSILDERVLNGLTETYTALSIPIDLTVESIKIMQDVTNGIIGDKNNHIIADSFDYLCNQLTQKSNTIKVSENKCSDSCEDQQDWDLKNDCEWLNSENCLTNLIGSISDDSAFVKALEYGREFRQSEKLIDTAK